MASEPPAPPDTAASAPHAPTPSASSHDRMVRRLAFLATAGEVLSSSLDYAQTLQDVAHLAVPALGDLCVVDVLEHGVVHRVASAHVNPQKATLLESIRRSYPLTPDSPQPAARALRSGRVELIEDVGASLTALTRDAEHARLIRALDVRTYLAIPLLARQTTLGVISFAIGESDRRYLPEDVALAEDLARRAAIAIDNARLYDAAQREIAERRRADEALRLSEERFRAMVEQSPLSTQILSPDGTTLRVNRAWEALWGFTADQIAGYNLLRDPQLKASGIAALLRRACAGEAVGLPAIKYDPAQTRLERDGPDPGVRWVRAFAYPVKSSTGEVREIVLVHEDVTTAHDAEGRLKASEERLQLLADAGDVLGASLDYHATLQRLSGLLVPRLADWCAVDLLNDAGTLERVSVAHADPERIALATDLFVRFPPRPTDGHGAWRVIETGEPEWIAELSDERLERISYGAEHLDTLRRLRIHSLIRVPLAARGGPIGVLTLVYAESGRRYTEADVGLAMDLAARAATAVDNAQLYQQLRAEDRRKDEFLATLAHELRNPLAPIRTGLGLLRVTSDPQVAERTRQVMERQLGHMVRLIDDLLDLARVSRGRVTLERERVDLWSIVGSAIEASRPLLDGAGIQLVVRLPEAPIILDADRTRLSQVLSNLLNNAAKFTPRGGRVEVQAFDEATGVLLQVRDTGIGIPSHLLGHIFEMFAQAGDAHTRTQGGLGIGLTLVRRLVELHGGRVWAESDGPDTGSTFSIHLPKAEPSLVATPLAGQTAAATSPSARRVLVVDDNADAAEMLASLLALDGHEVRSVGNGPAALEVVQTFHPDVAFLDIGLPGMTGYELARRLRATPALAGVLLVAVTGWGQDEDRRQSKAAGLDHHLTKPVEPEEVRRLVEALR